MMTAISPPGQLSALPDARLYSQKSDSGMTIMLNRTYMAGSYQFSTYCDQEDSEIPGLSFDFSRDIAFSRSVTSVSR